MSDLFSVADEREPTGVGRPIPVDHLDIGDEVECRFEDGGPLCWARVEALVFVRTNYGRRRVILSVRKGDRTMATRFLPDALLWARPA